MRQIRMGDRPRRRLLWARGTCALYLSLFPVALLAAQEVPGLPGWVRNPDGTASQLIEIDFCQFEVRDVFSRIGRPFIAKLEYEVGSEDEVFFHRDVSRVDKTGWPPDDASSSFGWTFDEASELICLSRWKLPLPAKSIGRAWFHWRPQQGWDFLEIEAGRQRYEIRASRDVATPDSSSAPGSRLFEEKGGASGDSGGLLYRIEFCQLPVQEAVRKAARPHMVEVIFTSGVLPLVPQEVLEDAGPVWRRGSDSRGPLPGAFERRLFECLKKWQIPGTLEPVKVRFYWLPEKGWKSLELQMGPQLLRIHTRKPSLDLSGKQLHR